MHPLSPRLVVLTLFLSSAACGILPEGDPAGTQTLDANTTGTATGGSTGNGKTVTYATDVAPILQTNCNICHGTGGANQSFFDCSSMAGVVKGATAMQGAVDGGSMPPSGALSAADKATIDAWVTGGMQ